MEFGSPEFWIAVLQIIAIDILLGGDNAVVIALACRKLPPRQRKLGIFLGLFNVFVVTPQLLVASVMGSITRHFFPTEPIWTMAFAAVTMAGAAVAMLRVRE